MKRPSHHGLTSLPLRVLCVFFFVAASYFCISNKGASCKSKPFEEAGVKVNQNIVHVVCSTKSSYVSLEANISTVLDKKYEISGIYNNFLVLWVFLFLGIFNFLCILFWTHHESAIDVEKLHNATKDNAAFYYYLELKSYSKKYYKEKLFLSALTLAVLAVQFMGFYYLLDVGNQGWPKIEWMYTEFEARSDPWTKFFPHEVWCYVFSEYYRCHLSANSSLEEIHFITLWLLLVLFVDTLVDIAGICYFIYAARSLPESQKILCFLREKNITDFMGKKILSVLDNNSAHIPYEKLVD